MKEKDVDGPLIGLQSKIEDNDFFGGDVNMSDLEDKLCSKDDGASKGVNGVNMENAEADITYLD